MHCCMQNPQAKGLLKFATFLDCLTFCRVLNQISLPFLIAGDVDGGDQRGPVGVWVLASESIPQPNKAFFGIRKIPS